MSNAIDLSLDPARGAIESEDDGSLVRRSILPGGVRVLTEQMLGFRSATVGMWIGAGSRDETEGTYGSTHFLEHLLFKGTKNRSSIEIAERGDYLGGGFNAATSKQTTNYHGHVFDEDLPAAIELLGDMVTSATLTPEAMEMERGVILEELAMYNDDASDVASETIAELVFGDHPMARPVGGTKETVAALEHDHLVAHYRKNYNPSELVVCAAGNVDHDAVCAEVVSVLKGKGWHLSEGAAPAPRRRVADIDYPEGSERYVVRPVEQSAVILGMPGLSSDDEDRAVLAALSAILGGGQSSRLFQEVREKHGLAYTTYSYPAAYREGGYLGLYGACAPDNARKVADMMGRTLDDMAEHGVSEEEVETAFRQIRAQLVFSGERIASRMNRLASLEITRGEYRSYRTVIERARSVTREQINELAARLARGPRSLVIVGPEGF